MRRQIEFSTGPAGPGFLSDDTQALGTNMRVAFVREISLLRLKSVPSRLKTTFGAAPGMVIHGRFGGGGIGVTCVQ